MNGVGLAAQRATVPDFETLARDHEQALRSVALRLCRGPSDAQDLVQDTLERALRSWGALTKHDNLRAWLLAILRNRFIDSCRQKARESKTIPAEELAETAAANDVEPEPRWARITTEEVRQALGGLPQEFRVVYEMHAIEHRSYEEIAAALKIPKATVGTRLLRARKKLKKILMPEDEQEGDE